MDDQAPAQPLNEPAVEAPSEAPSASTEPTPSASPEQPAQPETPAVEPQVEAEPQQPRPAQRRIQQLVQENKELRDQLSYTPTPSLTPQIPKLSEALAGKETIDPTELDRIEQQRLEQVAQSTRGMNDLQIQQLRQEMLQREAISEREREASVLDKKYDELNPDSPHYIPQLEEKVVSTWQRLAIKQDPYNPQRKYIDPSVTLDDVAKDLVDLARASAETRAAQVTAAMARQADNGAVTPTTDAPREKSTDEMSLDEHAAYLRAKGYNI